MSIHPECVSRGWLINKTEAPAAHNPCMVNGAEVKTSLYAKIHKPEGPQTSHWGARAWARFCPIRHRVSHRRPLSVTLASNGPRRDPLLCEGACQTLFFLPSTRPWRRRGPRGRFHGQRGTPQFCSKGHPSKQHQGWAWGLLSTKQIPLGGGQRSEMGTQL